MPDSKRKQKMISLRLSDEDYAVLKSQYEMYGARNVSDLARLALRRVIEGPAVDQNDVGAKLAMFDQRLHVLEFQVSLLAEKER